MKGKNTKGYGTKQKLGMRKDELWQKKKKSQRRDHNPNPPKSYTGPIYSWTSFQNKVHNHFWTTQFSFPRSKE